VVTGVRTPSNDGYSAVQLGFGEIDPRKVTKPVSGMFSKAGLTPRRYIAELRTDDASEYTLGQEVTAEVFASGQHVDVTGRSKGKGYAGVMKRHGFLARHPAQASLARFHRRVRHPGPGVQGRADGGPDGWRAHHRAVAYRARRRRRARAAPDQGRGSRSERPCRARPQRGQDARN
jgi:ribosomal protein L3